MFINECFDYISVRPTAFKLKNDPDTTILLSFNARQTILSNVFLQFMNNMNIHFFPYRNSIIKNCEEKVDAKHTAYAKENQSI